MTADIDDGRYNARNGVESSQNIASANIYVDLPPWDNNSSPVSMTASDGAFDSVVEAVKATIDTNEIAPGKHILYVVGTDADGNDGVFSAEFLEVIAGTCTNAGDNDGTICAADGDCSCGTRRLRGITQNVQDTQSKDLTSGSDSMHIRRLQNCGGATCLPGFICENQGKGVKECVPDGTAPPPTPPPSTSPTRAPTPLVCGCVFPTESPTDAPSLPPSPPTVCLPRGNACVEGQEAQCCSGGCGYRGPNYRCN